MKSNFCLWLAKQDLITLSERLKMSIGCVRRWRRGEGHPTPMTAARLIRMSRGHLSWDDFYSYLLTK